MMYMVGSFLRKHKLFGMVGGVVLLLGGIVYWQFPYAKPYILDRVQAAQSAQEGETVPVSPVPVLASLSEVQQVQNETKEVDSRITTQQGDIQKLRDMVSDLQQELRSAVAEVAKSNDLLRQQVARQSVATSSTTLSTVEDSSSNPGSSSTSHSTGLVHINTASSQELQTLPGIGSVMAGRIIDYRNKKGSFKKLEDLMEVSGIGQATFAKLEGKIAL